MSDFFEITQTSQSQEKILKEYYSRYLLQVRNNSPSTVKHYLDALNNISRRLREKNLVKQDIFEIADLEYLYSVRDIIYQDKDFIEANERGKRMYSAGLNNYCRFASGEGFYKLENQINILDVPVEPEQALTTTQTIWKRSGILKAQAFETAEYKCEFNRKHESFIAENTRKPYMEGHHALPMTLQKKFPVSLDVYANIICLCPICHKKIHYGLRNERENMIKKLYYDRSSRLANSGIKLCSTEFMQMVLNA